MAGIAGIIIKSDISDSNKYHQVLEMMIGKLASSEKQLKKSYSSGNFFSGNVIPISSHINDRYQFNEKLNVFCFIEGLIYVSETEQKIIQEQYSLSKLLSDLEYIPYLFAKYKKDLPKHITGWFNIVLFDHNTKEIFIINDPLGYLPLYVYESEIVFLFASRIESLLCSGLIPNPEFDVVTMAEHLYFNYPLSDHTYIKNINTLQNATIVHFKNSTKITEKYWSVAQWFNYKPLGEKESIEIINLGLKKSLKKLLASDNRKLNFSLTGGWDSRLILSFLLPKHKERLNLYSFGAEGSSDIEIPLYITKKEGLNYTSFVLNNEYIEHDFIPAAVSTIMLSNGLRNYKRTHYLNTIQKIAPISDTLISGIFGDEVFKISQITGGTVIAKSTIDLIETDFDLLSAMKKFEEADFIKIFKIDSKSLSEGLFLRLENLKKTLNNFETKSQKYCYIRFELNLRKFFGAEVNSYNDYTYCFSPFIDMDFLNGFAHTQFFGAHYQFNSNDLKLKMKTTLLYYELTKRNYKPLLKYNSARGYSMKDAASNFGKIKIILKKYLRSKKNNNDGFNTDSTNIVFLNYLEHLGIDKKDLPLSLQAAINKNKVADVNSLIYWAYDIMKKYM